MLSKTQHCVGHVDLVEQVPRVQGVLVVTVHALSTQLVLDTLDHSHGNTIAVVRLALSKTLEVIRVGCRATSFGNEFHIDSAFDIVVTIFHISMQNLRILTSTTCILP